MAKHYLIYTRKGTFALREKTKKKKIHLYELPYSMYFIHKHYVRILDKISSHCVLIAPEDLDFFFTHNVADRPCKMILDVDHKHPCVFLKFGIYIRITSFNITITLELSELSKFYTYYKNHFMK